MKCPRWFPLLLAVLAGREAAAAREPERARHAMVVTVEPHATDAGVALLQSGGNAVDAAVGIGLALAVTHPSAGNLGGGGFMLIRFADGRSTFIDFRERAPGKARPDMYLDRDGHPTSESELGYRAVGVPGTPRGLEYALRSYGRKPWAEVIRPACRLAAEGFPVSYDLARSLQAHQDRLARFPDSRRVFLRNGRPFEPGERFRQPELARTLERLRRHGAADFYTGQTARWIVADMAAHDGWLTLDDLAHYRVIERPPLTGSYRDCTILTAPPPSSGGLGILYVLGMLEPTDFPQGGAGSAQATHFLAEGLRRYFADRSRYLGDPDFVSVPTAALLAPAYLAGRRQTIDPARATPSSSVAPGQPAPAESGQTTHYSVVDADGTAVAVTYTLNGSYGSGVTAAGTGVLLNNEMDDFSLKAGMPNSGQLAYAGSANSIQPHKTPLSSMAPTIVARNGRLYAVLGSPGGPTIISTVLETLVNLVDFKMNAADAVAQPRCHHQWLPDRLEVERGFSPDTIAQLRARGHTVRVIDRQGEVAAIVVNDGWLEGAADPRTAGTARGY